MNENKIIEEFDRAVFESVVDHVIIGGYDENGDKDPEMISFVYKTGFRDTLDGGKFRKPRKVRVDKKTGVKGLASPSQDNAMEKLYTLSKDDARRDVGVATIKINKKYTEILSFPMYCKHFVFTEDADGYKQKILKEYRTVKVLVELD